MAEEVTEGDWISYPEGEGKVVGVDDDGYGVRPKELPTGVVFVPKGERIRKIAPPGVEGTGERGETGRMPTDRSLLESLRDGFANLEYGDEDTLSRLRNRGRMILRRIYGEPSEPYERLAYAGFQQVIPDWSAEEQSESWEADQREITSMLEALLEEMDLDVAEQEQSGGEHYGRALSKPKSNRVFVVHGHDEGMRESVARVLTTLGLEPVILHEQPNCGRTIIEKFYDYSDVGFTVVLLSPDDTGYTNTDGSDAAQARARQNVVLELGFFIGRLRRENVVALHKGNVEIPSDFSGVLYTPYDSGGAWQYKLAKELRASGYDADMNRL